MWLNPPPTPCSRSQPEPGCSAEASASPLSRSASETMLSAVVSGKVVPRPRSWRGWKTRQAAARLFGTMRAASSADGTGAPELVAALTSSAPATPANPSPPLADVLAQRMLATYGRQCVASLRDSNPASCFSRTSTATLALVCGKSFGIARGSATALRAACSRRRKLARRIFESGCSSSAWLTPSGVTGNHPGATDSLTGATKNWPTASASDWKVGEPPGRRPTSGKRLTGEIELWPTASADPSFPQGGTTSDDGLSSLLAVWTRPSCPRLSPAFQWWLMGWPHPAIYFGSAETASIQSVQPGLSSTCSLASWKMAAANRVRYLIERTTS